MLRSAGTATQVAAAAFPLLAPDGSGTAPSYAFAGEPNTGIFRISSGLVGISGSGVVGMVVAGSFVQLASGSLFAWTNGLATGTSDLVLSRDAANTLAQRNGTNAQTFRLYNTFTDASNYERLSVSWAGNQLNISTAASGTGTARSMGLVAAGTYIDFSTGGFNRWEVNNSAIIPYTDNTYDFGAPAFRPRNVYLGSALYLTSPTAQAAGTYTVLATDTTVINSVASTLTLPAVGTSTGRKVRVVTTGANAIISAASNVVPITGGAATTAILAATAGKWADLECNGTNWIITASN